MSFLLLTCCWSSAKRQVQHVWDSSCEENTRISFCLQFSQSCSPYLSFMKSLLGAAATGICHRSSLWPDPPATQCDSVLTCLEAGTSRWSERDNPHASGSDRPRQHLFSLLRSRSTCTLGRRKGHRLGPPNEEQKDPCTSGQGDFCSQTVTCT